MKLNLLDTEPLNLNTRLRQRIKLPLMKTSLQRRTEVVLNLDISGSIKGYETQVQSVAESYVREFTKRMSCSMAVTFFNSDVQVKCRLSNDRKTLLDHISDLPQAHGGTDFCPPLTFSRDCFSSSPNTSRHIVLVTDGITCNVESVRALCNEIKLQDIHIVTVGVGNLNRHLLESFASSPRSVHMHNNYAELLGSVDAILGSLFTHKQAITVEFYAYTAVRPGDNVPLSAFLKNIGSEPLHDVMLCFDGNGYVENSSAHLKPDKRGTPVLEPDDITRVEVELRVNGGKGIVDLIQNPCVGFKVLTKSQSQRHQIATEADTIQLLPQMFTGEVLDYESTHGVKSMHMGPVGFAGSGKSTLISNWTAFFSSDAMKHPTTGGRTEGSHTEVTKSVHITKMMANRLRTELIVTDIWGIERRSDPKIPFNEDLFIKHMGGYLENGFGPMQNGTQCTPKHDDLDGLLNQRTTVHPTQMIDYLMFVVELGLVDDSEVVQMIAQYCRLAETKLSRKYIVVVSHSDAIPNVEFADLFDKENAERKMVIDKLCSVKNCALDPRCVFFVSNDVTGFAKGELWKNEAVSGMAILYILQYMYSNFDTMLSEMIEKVPEVVKRLQHLARDFVFQLGERDKVMIEIDPEMSKESVMTAVRSHVKVRNKFSLSTQIYFEDEEDGVMLENGKHFFSCEKYGTLERPVKVCVALLECDVGAH